MNHKLTMTLCLTLLILMAACNKEAEKPPQNLGESRYHDSFLWSDEEVVYLERQIVLDFNQDAKDSLSYATLMFIDEDHKPLNMEEYEIIVDGKRLDKPEIEINATQDTLPLKMRCLPNVKSGTKGGFLVLKPGHTLDRINDTSLETDQTQEEILQWVFTYHNTINPLKFWVLVIGAILLAALIIWRVILRPIFFRTFGSIRKTMYFTDSAPLSIKFKGARKVVVSDKPHKQNRVDRFFKGKILYLTTSAVCSDIVFLPNRLGIVVKTNFSDYAVRPNPMPKIGECTITDRQTNNNIQIK